MKVLIYTDPHWSQYSSILRSRNEYHSVRLSNLIDSINWTEELAVRAGCTVVMCLGDFFDSNHLNAEEISALQHIRWSNCSHVFLTGNHETNMSNLEYSTADLFNLCPDARVVATPQQYFIDGTDCEFCFLPYVLERDRKTLQEYFGQSSAKRIIFSHNDLKDVQYGSFLSTEGFELNDIHENCDLYFNGHIHHCCNVTDKVINIGNLTGQNFTEDATKYSHCAVVIDTETLEYKFYENPYAFKFYKLDATQCKTEAEVKQFLTQIKSNGVVTLHVNSNLADTARMFLEELKKDWIHEYRVNVKHELTKTSIESTSLQTVDHLQQFEQYAINNIENSDIVKEELQAIMRG